MMADAFRMDAITRQVEYCNRCGLYFINPTFAPTELARLYSEGQMLRHYERVPSPGGVLGSFGTRAPEELWALEMRHSRHVYNAVMQDVRSPVKLMVVDVGGAYGCHLRFFEQDGHHCFVQDVIRRSKLFPGVQFIRSLASVQSADVVICTHVLEHIVEVGKFLADIRDKQAVGSLLYVEVPYEVDSRVRRRDFGTPFHVNFFSKESLAAVLAMYSYTPKRTGIRRLTYDGEPLLVIAGSFVRVANPTSSQPVPGALREVLRGAVYRLGERFTPWIFRGWQ